MTTTFDAFVDTVAWPYVTFVVLRYRLLRFIAEPMRRTIYGLNRPQCLAEFLVAAPLFALGLMIHAGVTGAMLEKVMPMSLWSAILTLCGGAHLVALFWGTRRARLVCSVFHPWVYAILLVALGALSTTPRLVVAFLGVSFIAALLIPFTLRDGNGS